MRAIVLAAGEGRRLGQAKAGLPLAGLSALQRCLRALEAGGLGQRVVVLAAGRDELARQAEKAGARVLFNGRPDAGQTSSLQLALADRHAPRGDFVVHPVDLPLLRPSDVAVLAAAFAGRPAGIEIVVPTHEGRRGHPACFQASLAAEFLALPPGEPGHAVVRRDPGRVLELPLENPWLVRDIDGPEDLAAVREELRLREG